MSQEGPRRPFQNVLRVFSAHSGLSRIKHAKLYIRHEKKRGFILSFLSLSLLFLSNAQKNGVAAVGSMKSSCDALRRPPPAHLAKWAQQEGLRR